MSSYDYLIISNASIIILVGETMAYGKYQPVDIPVPETGSIRIYKNNYVYYNSESHWDKSRKRTLDNRTTIGKQLADNPGKMYPNDKYFALFGNISIVDEDSNSVESTSSCSTVINFASWYALKQASDLIGCTKSLKIAFPKQAKQILALAIYAILDRELTAQSFEFWYYHNYSGLNKCLFSSEISQLYHSMMEEDGRIACFNEMFKEEYFKTVKCSRQHQRRVVGFDSTNQNSACSKNSIAGYGHAKKNKGLPVINTAMFVDEVTGIPLYYEHFEGSILDKSQTPYTLEKTEALGFKKLFIMMDRGYYSKDAINALKKENEFGVMVPDNANLVDQMIGKYAKTIQNKDDYWIQDESIYGIHIENQAIENLDGSYDVYLYYDDIRAGQERKSIHDKIAYLEKSILSRKRYSEKLANHYQDWFTIEKLDSHEKGERNFSVNRKSGLIQDELERSGLFVIVSNGKLSAEEMIKIARHRDRSEKAFRRIKSCFNMESTYTHFDDTYEAKMFICYIALIVEESYRWFIKPFLDSTSSRTTQWSLGQLSKYQIHFNKKDKKWHPMTSATKIQKEIFSYLQKTEADLHNEIEVISLRV